MIKQIICENFVNSVHNWYSNKIDNFYYENINILEIKTIVTGSLSLNTKTHLIQLQYS